MVGTSAAFGLSVSLWDVVERGGDGLYEYTVTLLDFEFVFEPSDMTLCDSDRGVAGVAGRVEGVEEGALDRDGKAPAA